MLVQGFQQVHGIARVDFACAHRAGTELMHRPAKEIQRGIGGQGQDILLIFQQYDAILRRLQGHSLLRGVFRLWQRAIAALYRNILRGHRVAVGVGKALHVQGIGLAVLVYKAAHRHADDPQVVHQGQLLQHAGRQRASVNAGRALYRRVHILRERQDHASGKIAVQHIIQAVNIGPAVFSRSKGQ